MQQIRSEAPPVVVQPEPVQEPSSNIKIKVNAFRIAGNEQYSESTLQTLVKGWTGRDLEFADLEQAAGTITAFYREHGFILARAYLPEQEIRGGIVEIHIIEGKIHRISVQLKEGTRLSETIAKDILDKTITQGEPLSRRGLERGLLIINDIQGVEAQSTLKPGAVPGSADLILEISEKRALSGSLEYDNFGNSYTGYNRFGASLSLNDLIGEGETFTLRGITTGKGITYGRGSFQIPVGPWGTNAGGAFSYIEYELGEEYEDLDAHGTARVASAFLLHPLVRSRNFNLYGQAGFDWKNLRDLIDFTDSKTEKKIIGGSFSLLSDVRDDLLGGGLTSFSLDIDNSTLSIETPEAEEIDSQTARTDGRFTRTLITLSRLQKITGPVDFFASYTEQITSRNLDTSEQLSLGGPFAVRSYPLNEADSDEGYILTGEVRWTLPQLTRIPGTLQLTSFIDVARGRLHKDPWTDEDNKRSLKGIGVGINWYNFGSFLISTNYSHKLGNEDATVDKDRSGRFWAQAVKYF